MIKTSAGGLLHDRIANASDLVLSASEIDEAIVAIESEMFALVHDSAQQILDRSSRMTFDFARRVEEGLLALEWNGCGWEEEHRAESIRIVRSELAR